MPDIAGNPVYPNLPSSLSSFGAAVVGEYLYVYGGHAGQAHNYSRETTLNKLRRLHIAQPQQWEELPTGPKLQGLALVAHGGNLYRIGGMQPQNAKSEKPDTRSQATSAKFDPATKLWSEIEPLPEPRSSHDSVVVGDSLFVFGGWRLNGLAGKADWHDHGWRLDLQSPGSGWHRLDQPFRRRALTMAARAGKVYVIGGITEAGKVECTVNVFDTAAESWSDGPPLPVESSHGFTPAAATLDERLFVAPANGKMYQLEGDHWQEIATTKDHRFSARMVSAASRLLILGGASSSGLLASCEAVGVAGRH